MAFEYHRRSNALIACNGESIENESDTHSCGVCAKYIDRAALPPRGSTRHKARTISWRWIAKLVPEEVNQTSSHHNRIRLSLQFSLSRFFVFSCLRRRYEATGYNCIRITDKIERAQRCSYKSARVEFNRYHSFGKHPSHNIHLHLSSWHLR